MTKLNTTVFHPAWVVGFIDGEGTFHVAVQKNSTMALGYQVQLQFAITQHNRDKELMSKFPLFFNCGYIASDGDTKKQFRIRDFKKRDHLFELIDNYPLLTQKRLDAEAFRQVHAMMCEGLHLTSDGLDAIRTIKQSMNRSRK
jgi:hypothetical protein